MSVIFSAQSIGNIYWALSNLQISPSHPVFDKLDKLIIAYIDEFSWLSLSNIMFEKFVALRRYQLATEMMVALNESLEYRVTRASDMRSVKVVIYSLGRYMTRGKDHFKIGQEVIQKLAMTWGLLLKNDRHGLDNFRIDHVQEVIYSLTKFEIKSMDIYNVLLPYTKRHINIIKGKELALLVWSVCHLFKWELKLS